MLPVAAASPCIWASGSSASTAPAPAERVPEADPLTVEADLVMIGVGAAPNVPGS